MQCTRQKAKEIKSDFLKEIELTIQIGEHGEHPNVLPTLGCCTQEDPYFLITPFMKYGDLLRFLRKAKIALSVSNIHLFAFVITSDEMVYPYMINFIRKS